MLDEIYDYICEQKLFIPGERVLIGVSGGIDSVALSYILYALRDRLKLSMRLAYFDHALRPDDADKDLRFIHELAERLNMPVLCGFWQRGKPKASLENEARNARYAFFHDQASSLDISKIVLGHTFDDQAETILEHLLRGSGMRGLCGMQAKRNMRGLTVVRPLLCMSRIRLRAYLEHNRYTWREDRTNQDLNFLRNRIRHILIPMIQKEFNPGFKNSLVRLGELMRGDEQILAALTQEIILKSVRAEGELFFIAISDIKNMTISLARRIVQALYQSIKPHQQLSFQHIQDILSLIQKGQSGHQLHLPGHVRVWLAHGLCYFGPDALWAEMPEDLSLEIPSKGRFSFAGGSFELSMRYCERDEAKESIKKNKSLHQRGFVRMAEGEERIEYFDAALIKGPVRIRSLNPGDIYDPIGLGGAFKKVKKIFINEKIPNHLRKKIPVFSANGKIFWIGGYRISDSFKVREKTQKIVELRLCYPI